MKKVSIILIVFLTFSIAHAQYSWEFEEETYINGSISGTITYGYIFKTSSQDYYVVLP